MTKKKAPRGNGQTRWLAEQLRDAIEADGEHVCVIAELSGIPKQVLHRFYTGQQNGIELVTLEKLMEHLSLEIVTKQ